LRRQPPAAVEGFYVAADAALTLDKFLNLETGKAFI
jgi:hypothetical protein